MDVNTCVKRVKQSVSVNMGICRLQIVFDLRQLIIINDKNKKKIARLICQTHKTVEYEDDNNLNVTNSDNGIKCIELSCF